MGRAAVPAGRIGPNALTQMIAPLERLGGASLRDELLARAGIAGLPDMTGLIDEAPVARLHALVRRACPQEAAALARAAGRGTADYVIAHRIPATARLALRLAPAPLGARLLGKAIARNAWTFAGSGDFRVVRAAPPVFEIADNPLIRGERAGAPICHWHAAVFERLFAVLVSPRYRAEETCCAAKGDGVCRFALRRV